MRRIAVLAVLGVAFAAFVSVSNNRSTCVLVGVPRVIDGDTLAIDIEAIRLYAIDSRTLSQLCLDRYGAAWACGREAYSEFKRWLGKLVVTCEVVSTDSFQRNIALCSAEGYDKGRWLVWSGFASAYVPNSKVYIHEEEAARAKRVGVWRGAHVPPWEHRRSADGAH